MKPRDADEFRRLVLRRTKLTTKELVCPREKSEMTPCIARDGNLAVATTKAYGNVCVGCSAQVESLIVDELAKDTP